MKKCIILLADGSRYDVFKELIDQGLLPNITRHLVEKGAFTSAVTAFPSTTGPAHMPFLTGCLPATCNVPGIRWFDKRKVSFRSYVGIETFKINSDMRNDIRTVFDIIPRSYSIFNSINRGVGARNLTRISRIWYWYYGHLTDRWAFVDASAYRKILSLLDKNFEFLFVVLPAIDEYSHLSHPRNEYAIKQYLELDSAVGKIVEKLGSLDDTLLWIVSDHGLSKTHTHFCVNTFLESRGIRTFYYPLIYRKGCVAANMVSGNGMTHLYFKRKDGWGEPARIEDINDMHPGLLEELVNEPAVDILAGRDREGDIVVMSKKGSGKVKNGGASQFLNDNDYPDAPFQLSHIFTSPRCGDVILSAAPGYDLRLKYEDPEHKSSHGSLHREHMIVPLICNVKLPTDRLIRTVDVFPTYLKMMGHAIPDGIDGNALL